MPRRTEHEMDEWPDIRRPWYVKFWRVVYVWMAVVVVVLVVGSVWRTVELKNARVEDCVGVVKSINVESVPAGTGNEKIVTANVSVRGKMLEIPIDTKVYPDLRVGDRITLTCRIGGSGSLFVQKWRPAGKVSSKQ